MSEGFILEHRSTFKLADCVTHGPPGSAFSSCVYGPKIRFCPFCGATLEPEVPAKG